MYKSNAMFPILGHPVMRLESGFIELPMDLGFRASVASLPEHAAMRATNHAVDEQMSLRLVCYCSCYRHWFVVGVTNEQEREKFQVSSEKIEEC